MLDVLLIGQGIAGSSLAYQLLKRNYKVAILDNGHKQSASHISAGLMQHIYGKFMTMNPLINDAFDTSINFYKTLENDFSTSFLKELDVYRVLDDTQLKIWQKKKLKAPYNEYLNDELITNPLDSALNTTLIKHNAVIHTDRLMTAFKHSFIQEHCYIDDEFDEQLLELHDNYISYKEYKAAYIIFCTGAATAQLDFFKHYPFENKKGDTVSIQSKDLTQDQAFQHDYCIAPQENTHKVGANYSTKMSLPPTKDGYDSLTDFLSRMGLSDYDILCHHSGIRCVMDDKNPIMGWHPTHQQIGVLSGLGSRGYITAPYLATAWADVFPKNPFPSFDLKRF